jgi:succinoglycan biosynthesis transport protein ExoP
MATLQRISDAGPVGAAGNGGAIGTGRLAARSFLYAVFKHKWLVVGVFGVVVGTTTMASLLRPGAWLASTKVLVKLGEAVQLAPAEAPSRSMNLPLSQDVVRTEVDIVKSWEVVRDAVERLGITPAEGSSQADLIDGIRRALAVAPSPGTNMLLISLVGKNPQRAAQLVNAITDLYIDHHNRVYGREGIHSFYSKELRGLEEGLNAARERLRTFMEQADVTDIDQEIRLLNEEIVVRDKAIAAHAAKIDGAKRRLASVQVQLAETPVTVDFAKDVEQNPTRERYQEQLADLQIKRAEASQLYLPNDRHVRDLDNQIADLMGHLHAQAQTVVGKQTLRRNELHDDLQKDVYHLQTQLTDLESRQPVRVASYEEAKRRLDELRDQRFVINDLQREVDQKQYAYDLYWKKREEARISEAMVDQSLVDVSVVEHAIPPRTPQNGVLLPILLGLIGGLTLATAMAVGVEFLNGRLRFEEEVEHYLELPVLAVIPDFESSPDLANT